MLGSWKRRSETIIVAAIVGAVAAGGPAVAAEVVSFAKSAGNANTVNKIGASKTPRAGLLLPLNAKGQFPAGVLAAGRGAAGSTGQAGQQGAQGAPGAAGANGASGSQGAKGDTGAAGTTGPTGAAGPLGPAGAAGTVGPLGPDGASGSPGAKGDTGAAGTVGPLGPDGASGSPGAKGDTGAAGATGPTGAAGPVGPAGAAGTVGPQGPAGAAGTGVAGLQGPKGDKGDKGDTGNQGPAGDVFYPAVVDINPTERATRENLWESVLIGTSGTGASWNNAFRSSNPGGDQSSFLEWDLPLAAGTWSIEVTYAVSTDAGKLTFSLDGADSASINTYASAVAYGVSSTVPITVPEPSGVHTLKVRMSAPNDPASTGFFGYLHWLRLVKQ